MIEKLKLPELAVCAYADTDKIIDHILVLGNKINEIIDHLPQEKEVGICNSCKKICKKEFVTRGTTGETCPVYEEQPTKEVQDMIDSIAEILERVRGSDYDSLEIAQEISALYTRGNK